MRATRERLAEIRDTWPIVRIFVDPWGSCVHVGAEGAGAKRYPELYNLDFERVRR